MKKIFIDIGSRTTKAFIAEDRGGLKALQNIAIDFNENFSEKSGVSTENKNRLCDFIQGIRSVHQGYPIVAFATAFFRKISEAHAGDCLDNVFDKTGVRVDVLSENTESKLLASALAKKWKDKEPFLIIGIGGLSVELIVIKEQAPIDSQVVRFGITDLLSKFPNLNNEFSPYDAREIKDFIKTQLPVIKERFAGALTTGSELSYMKLLQYPLVANTLFNDADHPSMLSREEYGKRNHEVCRAMSIRNLELLMPENPKRMRSARSAILITEAICEKYGISYIVPSDFDIAHGVFEQELQANGIRQ